MSTPTPRSSARTRVRRVGAAGLAVSALTLTSLSGSIATQAAATSEGNESTTSASPPGTLDVVNTETVQAYLDPDGSITSQRVYEQLVVSGEGSATIANPVSTDGLRNLDGFGGWTVEDGAQSLTLDVDGVERLRSVSDYEGEMPLAVDVSYLLDGEPVEADDVVGADGLLEVRYTLRNTTGRTQEVSFPDGNGGTVTEQATVAVPLVAAVETDLPANFVEVASEGATMAGNGRGGTILKYTLTLFPPVGEEETTIAWQAQVEDAVVPRVGISALPINPYDNPTLRKASDSYASGAETGAELTAGATEIDTNLLKLRDGAGELLAGLLQLSDGAGQLRDGLADEAAPGARKIADGAGTLAAGNGTAAEGGTKLRDGLELISGGLGRLADAEAGLPAAADGVGALKSGVDQLLAGLGKPGQAGTLLDGLTRLAGGLDQLTAGSGQLAGGLTQLRGGLGTAKGGVDQVRAGLQAAASATTLPQLIAALGQVTAAPDCGPTCQAQVTDLVGKFTAYAQATKGGVDAAVAALGQISAGLGAAVGALDGQLVPGAQALANGLASAAEGADAAAAGAGRLQGGTAQVADGLGQLQAAMTRAVAGVLQLSSGSQDAYAGSSDLVDGLARLREGAGKLAAGGDDLADGLADAADGSTRLADGLEQAAAGAPKLQDGAQRLSTEGMGKLIEAGEGTAQEYGRLYAVIEAGAARADAEKMAFGAPEGAKGITAYSLELVADTGEDERNVQRALVAALVLALGLGSLGLRRRLG